MAEPKKDFEQADTTRTPKAAASVSSRNSEPKVIDVVPQESASTINDVIKKLYGNIMPGMQWSKEIANVLQSYHGLAGFSNERSSYSDPFQTLVETPAKAEFRSELDKATAKLRQEAEDLKKKLSAEHSNRKELEAEIRKLVEDKEAIRRKEELGFLLDKVTPLAEATLLSDKPLKSNFFSEEPCKTFVMSIDIRRSTELMLKAKRPELFAQFMTELCQDLANVIKAHYGVVDKFTGDGMLAFFPEFFSGDEAAYLAIATADAAHRVFAERYREHRKSFTTVLKDVGMGIGIDYGEVRLVRVAGALTVVGTPVVYACRMGSAPAGKTLMNQSAYEELLERFSRHCHIEETEVDFKHEGATVAYSIRLNPDLPVAPSNPSWLEAQT